MSTPPRITADELLTMPDDGHRYELLEGDVYQMASPSTRHQRVTMRVGVRLLGLDVDRCGEAFMGPLGVIFDADNLVQPDALFISKERERIIHHEAVRGAPDLIVEVISPETRERDTAVKFRVYERAGVRHYWPIDPEAETVTRFRLTPAGRYECVDTLSRGDTLDLPLCPGVAIPVADLFD